MSLFGVPRRWRRGVLYPLLAPLLHAQRKRLLLVLGLMPVAALMTLVVPYLTKVAIDDYIVPAADAGSMTEVRGALIVLVLLGVVAVILGYLADALYTVNLQRVGQTLIDGLRRRVYARTLRLPRRYYDDHPTGTLLTRVTSDMEALGEGLASGVLGLLMDSLKTLAILAMMLLLDWRLTLVLLLMAPVLIVLVNFFQSRLRRAYLASRQALAEATGYLQEVLSGIKTVQLYNAEQLAIRRFERRNRAFLDAQTNANAYDALLFSLVEGVTTLALALLLWYAAGELLAGLLTLGLLVAFMEYIQRLFVPVREFAQQIAVLQRALGALDHIAQICREPLDPAETPDPDGAPLAPFRALEFAQVGFRYREHEADVLEAVSFTLARGQTLAVVGPSGSGKSTLIRLLTRTYGGYRGSIRINDEELDGIPADRLARRIAVVHQHVFLYQGTLAFNIGLDRPGIDRTRIGAVARYVNLAPLLQRLPGGLDARIEAGGGNLSAGEAQLIALARAVAEDTDVIVLDEATSAIDSMTEALIQQAIGRLYRDKTVIAIAHRLSTVRDADQILVMDGGRVVERGRHAELLAHGGLYAELVGQLVQAESAVIDEQIDGQGLGDRSRLGYHSSP